MTVSSQTDMTQEQRDVLGKIEKLLRLAGKTTSEAEAASATAKAQELLLAYNLSEAALGGGAEDGRRSQEKMEGGFYEYERDLMARIADVNFCLYWYSRDWIDRPENEQKHAKVLRMTDSWRRRHILRHRHHLVGRVVSVMATRQMYSYLTQTIERLTRDFVSRGLPTSAEGSVVGLGQALRSRRAVSFREGVAASVASKLWERRQDQIAEERKARAAEEARAAEAAAAGASSSTAITISSLRQSEEDANMDVIYGEGWSAKQRAARAERARLAREAEEAYTRWAEANPEEARAQAEERRLEEEKARKRRASGGRGSRGGSFGKEVDWAAYEAGREVGQSVGLDPQAEHSSRQRRIAG